MLTNKCFNYVYKNEQNMYWQVGLYTFLVIPPWEWHLGVETYRSLCISCVLHHRGHLLDTRLMTMKLLVPWNAKKL